jgi:ankyrin repeat protein
MSIFELVESNNLYQVAICDISDINKMPSSNDMNYPKSYHDISPLILAAKKGYIKMAKLLVARGANVFQKDKCKGTAIYYAACYNQPEIIEFLIECGAKVNHKCYNGNTPLMAACCDGINREAIQMLVKHGARFNIKNDDERSVAKRDIMAHLAMM